MTPSLQHAGRLAPQRALLRWPLHLSFRTVLVLSGTVHVALFALLAALPAPEPQQILTVYTVRVVDAPEGGAASAAGGSRRPASPAPAAEPRGANELPTGTTSPDLDAAPSAPVPTRDQTSASTGHVAKAGLVRDESVADAPPAVSNATPMMTKSTAGTASSASSPVGSGLPSVDAEALDPGFTLMTPIEMAYPDAARRARKAGRVRLEVEVGPDGRVLTVQVIEATPGWGFADAARGAYEGARFSPPRWQGRPVRVLWRKTLLFQP